MASTSRDHRITVNRRPTWESHTPQGKVTRPVVCGGGRGKGGRCKEQALFVCSYTYVTGRRGRLAFNDTPMCPAHAQAFAERHGLEVPELAA